MTDTDLAANLLAEIQRLRAGVTRRMESLSDGEPVKWDLRAILDGRVGDKAAQDLDDILDALDKAEARCATLQAKVERVETERDRLRAKVDAMVRDEHQMATCSQCHENGCAGVRGHLCERCLYAWPCPAIAALDGPDA
jgi:uncharacterized small protein (DUF1192 family)